MSRIIHGIAEFTYRAGADCGKNNVFFIESVGESLPCAEYLVERTRIETDTKSIYVFEYVLKGKGHIECDGKKHTVGEGDFYFLNRLHSHFYYSDREDPYRKVWINAGGRLLDGVVNAYGLTDGAIVIPESKTLVYFERIRDLLSNVNVDNSDEIMTECAKIMCELIITAATEHRKVQRATVSTAERIKDYIDSGLSYNVTLDDIAQRFYLNKSYIISIFSDKYGYTPKQYILQRKMQSACTMLEDNLYSIAEIADVLNFSSSQHFSSSFKKKIGISPDEYRKQKTEKNGF
ncbi:MAG: helix-turn-helix transcriptional regulator [Clostridia bacterium]|nr:helix-turn-helix transcriptional regulator [Clostridia bacterium]